MKIPQDIQKSLIFFVNGVKITDDKVDPTTTLATYLRKNLKLTGTKIGCNEGGCGACTVMISEININGPGIKHYSVNACLTPVCSVHGKAVTTVEGIGSVRTKLHPVQEVFSQGHGSQCGFCTPGFIMAMYSLLKNNPHPAKQDIDDAMQGNLCRCTGYRPILESFYTFAKTDNPENESGNLNGNSVNGSLNGNGCCGGSVNGNCCKMQNNDNDSEITVTRKLEKCQICDETQDVVFPAELLLNRYDLNYLKIEYESYCWYKPNTLEELLEIKDVNPNAKIVVGNSEIGVEMKFKNFKYPVLIGIMSIPELKRAEITDSGLFIGGAVTLTGMEEVMKKAVKHLPESQTKYFVAFIEMLHWFAGKHIRNAASPSGNLMTASPISDLNPLFMASGSVAVLQSKAKGQWEKKIDSSFFLGYRKANVCENEILVGIKIPFSNQHEHFDCYKQAQRREDDIAIVNAGMRVAFKPMTNIIEDIRLSFGGMAPTTVMPDKISKHLVGRAWDKSLLEETCGQLLLDYLPLPPGVPGGMEKFRQSLCLSFFYKFYTTVCFNLLKEGIICHEIDRRLTSCIDKPDYMPMAATRVFQVTLINNLEVPTTQCKNDLVSRSEMHLSAEKHTTGEAIYCDDISMSDALHGYFVTSTKSRAKIKSVNSAEALKINGVIAYIDHNDVPKNGKNVRGMFHDEEVFVTSEVYSVGQIIGMIVAESAEIAQNAVRFVNVEYEEYPAIITIDQALEKRMFYNEKPMQIVKGDCNQYFTENKNENYVEGQIRVGGQEHFYLEPQACLAIPKECEEMEIISSTQDCTSTQMEVSLALGIPANRVVASVKRIGGGFGGKETQSLFIAIPCAIAAAKLRRPVKCTLERYDDMIITGTRHPFLCNYKMTCNAEGKFTAYYADMYSNAGYSLDLSMAVMQKACLNGDGPYNIEHERLGGHLCKTDRPSATAFRAFGAPQSMITLESCITDMAYNMGVLPEELRPKNFYAENDETHFKQTLEKCNVRRCWDECFEMSKFYDRRKSVDEFNKNSRFKKRGISLIPTKFGIGYEVKYMNQGGALIHIYKDGSVLVTHGGMEMGQGLHTKAAQVVTRVLGVPLDQVYINNTSTDKVPNSVPTAASVGADLHCEAVKIACETLMERLKPVLDTNKGKTWAECIMIAYTQMINLSANGFYRLKDTQNYDIDTGTGTPFTYFSYGAACSEVEVDCLTGDHRILKTDIVMDVGDSLNPAIDIGQIEGAFVQGAGLYTFEELKSSPIGVIYTRGPGTYKIPSADDTPREFNVKLLKGSSNPYAVFSSKAIGEPPLFLGSTVFFAIKDAIKSAREECGLKGAFRLDSPASPERIRLACQDHITKLVPTPEPGTYNPWTVDL